jgi:hypothetical protein
MVMEGGAGLEEEPSQMVEEMEEALGLIDFAGGGLFGNEEEHATAGADTREEEEEEEEEDSDDVTIHGSDEIKSFSQLSDAVEELEEQQHEAQSSKKVATSSKKRAQKPKSVVHRLLEEALNLPARTKTHSSKGRVIKRKKAFDEYVTLDWLAPSKSASEDVSDEETETEVETETEAESEEGTLAMIATASARGNRKTRKSQQNKNKNKQKKSLRVRLKNVSLGSKRNRAITLNYPPKGGKEKWSLGKYMDASVRDSRKYSSQIKLPGGKSVLIRGENDPLLGVDCISGRYRARFASKYLGRYQTAKEAAKAHDVAAIQCLENELKQYFLPTRRGGQRERKKKQQAKQHRAVQTLKKKKEKVKKGRSSGEVGEADALGHVASDSIYASDLDEGDLIPLPIATKGTHVVSWESSVLLGDRDISLSASKLNMKLPEKIAQELLYNDRGQYFTAEMKDEKGQLLMCKAHLMSAAGSGSTFLSLVGKWGHYARSRQLSATDRIFFFLSLHVKKRTKCFPLMNLAAHVRVKRNAQPPPVTILEPNVESELRPEALGFCYVPGRISASVVKNALRKIKSTKELVDVIRQEQQARFKAVKYRIRVVPVDPKRGFGLWVLEDIPKKGEVLFEYAGEILSPQEAGRREKGYSLNPNIQNYIYEGGRNAKSKHGDSEKPKIILDSTFFGNVSRY